jgi:hypothetical protein
VQEVPARGGALLAEFAYGFVTLSPVTTASVLCANRSP